MLRFGITPIDENNIMSVFNRGKGMQSFRELSFSDIILDAVERGYHHCEITLDIFQILPIPMNDAEIQKLRDIKKKYDITYSAHFPIWSIDLSSPNKFIREASAESIIHSYDMFKKLEEDIEIYVLHPTGKLAAEIFSLDIPKKYFKLLTALFSGFAVQGIKKVIRETKIDRTKIAIENIDFPFEGSLDIIKKIRGSGLCIDTGHFLGGFSGDKYSTGDAIIEALEAHFDKLIEIHLLDYNEKDRDHGALGTGGFPPHFLKVVNDYNFDGPIVFELNYEKALESINFIKKNLPEIEVPKITK